MGSAQAYASDEHGCLFREIHRLSSLVNELTLRCVLNGVDLPAELCPPAQRLPPSSGLDDLPERLVPWARVCRESKGTQDIQCSGCNAVFKRQHVPRSLQNLSLTSMPLPTATLHGILSQCQQLRSIALSECTFHANQFLVPATSLVSLTSMEIRKCQMSKSSAIETVSVALELPQLHALVLNDCCLGDLGSSKDTPQDAHVMTQHRADGQACALAVLDIAGLPASDDAVQALVKRCPRLLALGLRATTCTDATIAVVAATCPLLQALDLAQCPAVTPASASQLRPLTRLHALCLPPTVTLAAFAALSAHLPALRMLRGDGLGPLDGARPQSGRSIALLGQDTTPTETADGGCQTDLSVFHPRRMGAGCCEFRQVGTGPAAQHKMGDDATCLQKQSDMAEVVKRESDGSRGKLKAAGVPLGAPLRTGGWRLPDVSSTGAKLLRQVSKASPSKRL
eukprot:jgi/Ulvmu1/6881/UM031_0086.1